MTEKKTSDDSKRTAEEEGRPIPLGEAMRTARSEFTDLTGLHAESVSRFERAGDGWALEVEVMELERVPDTMSLMASYEVTLDEAGHLTGYRRVRRYERGRADSSRRG